VNDGTPTQGIQHMNSASHKDYAIAELMACVLSRELKNGELGAMGAASQIPMAATKLAIATHAPDLNWLAGGSGAINSQLPYLVESAADPRNLMGADCRLSMEDIVDTECGGHFDWVCYGAIQVDRRGNLNMMAIGDYKKPTVRGPGSVGLSLAGAFGRYFIYLAHHDKRNLVERVDFISGPGFCDGGPERDAMVQPGARGPVLCVTPLCVFDFDPDLRTMRLKSVHPGVTVEDVLARTGFTPIMPDQVEVTAQPTLEEMRLLRDVIDREGVLRKLIA
jgi:glutaconate CoA-transferase, subunit B